jgi:hypothetical protein
MRLVAFALVISCFVSAQAVSAATPCAANGRNDDTACLNSLLARSGYVRLDAGKTYLINNSLWIPEGAELDGANATITTKNAKSKAWLPMLFVTGSNVRIHNLNITSAVKATKDKGKSNVIGINLGSYVSNIDIDSCNFHGTSTAISIQLSSPGIHDVSITRNQFHGTGYAVLTNGRPRRQAEVVHGLQISQNYIQNVRADGIAINSPVFGNTGTGDPSLAVYDVEISDNTVQTTIGPRDSAGFCIDIAGGKQVKILRNRLYNCSWQGIHLEDTAQDVEIRDNLIQKVYAPVRGVWKDGLAGIWVIRSKRISILNNKIQQSANAGIDIASWPGQFAKDSRNILISGNTISGAGTYGLRVRGNKGADLELTMGPSSGLTRNKVQGAANKALCIDPQLKGVHANDGVRDVCAPPAPAPAKNKKAAPSKTESKTAAKTGAKNNNKSASAPKPAPKSAQKPANKSTAKKKS